MAFVVASISFPAFAGYVAQATVLKVRATEYNAYFVFVDKNIVDRAPCYTSSPQNAFVLDASTAGGRVLANTILAAQVTKAKVTIAGRGQWPIQYPGPQASNVWGGIETVNYVDLE
jgi:hypothetical protein